MSLFDCANEPYWLRGWDFWLHRRAFFLIGQMNLFDCAYGPFSLHRWAFLNCTDEPFWLHRWDFLTAQMSLLECTDDPFWLHRWVFFDCTDEFFLTAWHRWVESGSRLGEFKGDIYNILQHSFSWWFPDPWYVLIFSWKSIPIRLKEVLLEICLRSLPFSGTPTRGPKRPWGGSWDGW